MSVDEEMLAAAHKLTRCCGVSVEENLDADDVQGVNPFYVRWLAQDYIARHKPPQPAVEPEVEEQYSMTPGGLCAALSTGFMVGCILLWAIWYFTKP